MKKFLFLFFILAIYCFNIHTNSISTNNISEKSKNNFNFMINEKNIIHFTTDEENENNELVGAAIGYAILGVISFPLVLSLTISHFKYAGRYDLGYSDELLGGSLASSILGGLLLIGIYVPCFFFTFSSFKPLAIYSSVLTGIYFINFIVSVAGFAISQPSPFFYGELYNDFWKNYFISSSAMLGSVAIISIVAWILEIMKHKNKSRSYINNRNNKIEVNFIGSGLSIKFY